ncbi:MAG: hypothetical protein DHS80DRAFT_29444 [Piptocephalis tieghemiana]|nr:MAG: hypothetical protein DHS80DRAFT_29444 [Piptocephalis tieghemiana]
MSWVDSLTEWLRQTLAVTLSLLATIGLILLILALTWWVAWRLVLRQIPFFRELAGMRLRSRKDPSIPEENDLNPVIKGHAK